jgi:hypothetical protein
LTAIVEMIAVDVVVLLFQWELYRKAASMALKTDVLIVIAFAIVVIEA